MASVPNVLPTLRFLLHLAAFAQLGVLTRIVVGRLFGGSCAGIGRWNWAPCVTGAGILKPGGALFYDFPSNVLGSFIIGLLTAGSVLTTTYPQHIAPAEIARLQLLFLHRDSSLQGHTDLQIGLRTGYCGSLTTFSSWLLQVVELMVGGSSPENLRGSQWVQGLWALFLGVAGPLTALVVGQHTALAAAAFWHAVSRRCDASADAASVDTASSGKGIANRDSLLEEETSGEEGNGDQLHPPPQQQQQQGQGQQQPQAQPCNPSILVIVDNKPSSAAATPPQPPRLQPPLPPTLRAPRLYPADILADVLAAAVCLTLTGVSAAYIYIDRNGSASEERRFWWFALLLGPPGCLLRWYLSRYNTLPASWGPSWSWLQLGTFAANVAACALNFAAQAVLYRLGGSSSSSSGGGSGLSGTQRVALLGLMVGSAGCLSTVSTWVAELQKLSLTAPLAAYKYGAASLVVPVVLGLIVYGIPVWTA